MNEQILTRLVYCYLGVILLSLVVSLVKGARHDAAIRIISVLLAVTLLTEFIAFFRLLQHKNNMPVYHVFNLVEFFLVCLYFNESIDVFNKARAGFYIGLAGIIIGIANIIFLQPLHHFNNYFLFFEGIVVISMSLFSFARLMLLQQDEESSAPLYWNIHFWIPASLTFFWVVTFCSWGMYEFVHVRYQSSMWIVHSVILVANIITYGSMGAMFVFCPRKKY